MAGPIASSGQGYIADPLFNALVPAEGPKGVPLLAPFSVAAGPYTVDLRQLIEGGQITNIQTVYIDNSQNASPVAFSVQGTGQFSQIPANSQAVLPLFCQKVARLAVQSEGTVDIPFILLNVPMPTAVWKVS
jgi:hypothetical protein